MEGDFVVVRSLDGPLVRVVASDSNRIVFISSPDQFELRKRGLPALDPVGFPREFVFKWDAATGKRIEDGNFRWDSAIPY